MATKLRSTAMAKGDGKYRLNNASIVRVTDMVLPGGPGADIP